MNQTTVIVGIDLGTSSCKVAAFDLGGKLLALAQRSYPLLTPGPGRVEQDPDQWWLAVAQASREVTAQIDPGRIAGIGLAGQSWNAVPLSRDGEVLAHSPIWMDSSAAAIAEELEDRVGADTLLRVCGNRLRPAYSTAKIVRFARERPDDHRRTVVFLQSNGFIGQRLTGVASQDRCQAYGLHCFDTRTGQYDADLAAGLGIDIGKLPPLVDCHEVIGTVTAQTAAVTGLLAGTPVVAGGLDASCACFGAGVWRPGDAQEQGGTGAGVSIVTDQPRTDARLISSRFVVPGSWLLEGGTVAGGASLAWARDQVGHPDHDFETLNRDIATVPAGAGGVWYLPYLAGERSPLWDPSACGVFYGLRLDTSRAALLRAVMEGVAYSLIDNISVAVEAGADCDRLHATGGAAASAVWTQIKADVTGRIIDVPRVRQPASLGAALLAGVGVGAYSSFAEAAGVTGQVDRSHIPGEDRTVYVAGFEVYRELYRALAPLMARTAGCWAQESSPSTGACPTNPARKDN
ncbi:MAG: hypothetical protein LBV00_07820 [Propionibacteriaceae bacterium]|nr:hypothetical protein [Propionibacteriaceae bacterium]